MGLEAALALTWASLALKRSPSGPRLTRLLGEPSDASEEPPARPSLEAYRVGWAVHRVAASAMLRRRGLRCEIHLGVVSTAPFQAHAWVTVRGTPIVGGPAHHATRVATFR